MIKSKVCHDCLKPSDQIWDYKGTPVCPNCYHRKSNGKKFINHNKPFLDRKPTIDDVKRKLEKKDW